METRSVERRERAQEWAICRIAGGFIFEAVGHREGFKDEVVGASTREAVRAMQVKYGLPADG